MMYSTTKSSVTSKLASLRQFVSERRHDDLIVKMIEAKREINVRRLEIATEKFYRAVGVEAR